MIEARHRQRDVAGRFRLWLLSAFRKLDEMERCARLRAALRAYKTSGAEHLVITGDLTEDGTQAQFELLAELLLDSGIDPAEITLTAGNHDAYTRPDAFERAIAGPLRAFARTSKPGCMTVLDEVTIVPVSTVIRQSISRSAGAIPRAHLEWVDRVARMFKGSGRAIAVAQHHQPFGHRLRPVNWIDGLQNHTSALSLLRRHGELHVLHGHRHQSSDRPVGMDEPPRVFGTSACVSHPTPLRLYEACDGQLRPAQIAGEAPKVTSWFGLTTETGGAA